MNGYIMGVWVWNVAQNAHLFTPTELVVMRKCESIPNPPRAANSVGVNALTDTHKKLSGGEMPSCLSVASSFKRTYSLETAVSAPCQIRQAGKPTMPNLERVV